MEGQRSHSRFDVLPEDLSEPLEVISLGCNAGRSSRNEKWAMKRSPGKPQEKLAEDSRKEGARCSLLSKEEVLTVDDNDGIQGWLLTGKRLQKPLKVQKRSQSLTEVPDGVIGFGLNTYPPSAKSLSDQRSRGKKYSRPLSTRPLGEPRTSYEDTRRIPSIFKEDDEIIPRLNSSPASLNRKRTCDEPKRAYSCQSRPRYPRTRSLSLPTQRKLEGHVVTNWEERKTNGVTYITPCLQQFSNK